MDISNRSSHAIEPHRNGKNGHSDRRLFQIGGLKFQNRVCPPNLVGTELTSADFTSLEARWIDWQFAEAAFLRRVDSFTGSQLMGRKGGDYAGIAIPYFAPGSHHVREYRLRRDHPDFEAGVDGQLRVKQKYLSPPGRGNMLYLPPGCDHSALQDPELPLIITEGEFKTLALSRLTTWNTVGKPRFLLIGIAGVFNWRGVIAKTTSSDGQRINVKGPIPDLDWIAWERRSVIIAFDADAGAKDQVRFARAELAQYLKRKGANIGFYEWDLARARVSMTTLPLLVRKSRWMKSHAYLSMLSIGAKS